MLRQVQRIALTVLLSGLCSNLAPAQAATLSGASWTPVNTGLSSGFFGIVALTVDPSTPSTLYAITAKGSLFKSTDGAVSWKPLNGVVGLLYLALDPKTSSTLYAATRHGVVKSTDGGTSWDPANGDLAETCYALAIDPVTPATVYGLSSGRIFKTTNSGETWKQIQNYASPKSTGSLVIDPTDPSTIYASANNAEIIKSTDGGENWVITKSGLPLSPFSTSGLPLAIDPRNPSNLYAGSFAASRVSTAPGVPPIDFGAGSISRSTDGGRTWIAVRTGVPSDALITSLTIGPESPSTIYAGYTKSGAGGILKSTNEGNSWTVINSDTFNSAIAAVDPRTPSTLYAAYATFSGSGTISKSVDAGSSWKPSRDGLDYPDLHVLAVAPSRATTVYTGGADGVFKSDDAGGDWINLAAFHLSSGYIGSGPAAVRSLLIDYKNPNILYAETLRVNGCAMDDNTVFKSIDGGATWSDSISPPASGCLLGGYIDQFTLMAIDPADSSTLYLAENESEDGFFGLLKSINGGASWSSIWNGTNGLVSALHTLAIDPVTTTTLYASVGSSGVGGVFKSTDGGASWNVTALRDLATVLTIDPANPGILYAGATGGLFKSTDAGASWEAINRGLTKVAATGATITAVVIAPNHSNIVYVATSGDGIYKSVDGGGTWTRFNDGLTNQNIQALAVVPGTPATLYAATPGGVFRTVDDPPPAAHGRRPGVR